MSIAIHASDLSKRYRLGGKASYGALRDSIARAFTAPFRRTAGPDASPNRTERGDTIWALRNVSFDIQHGDVIGLVGRNGSGKSTLLKILSRITEPTSGSATVVGRVGSLLEVGTGFHPELTGAENIYVNGALLGMRHKEIARKFDEIVAFADVARFIDTPVKHYSSGMQMRLAFSVAAHLEPEILLVDEVLAVGDIAFQKKCLGKMDEVSRHGRTIVFVSHQMNQIRRLCGRCLWLDAGQVVMAGRTADVINQYESSFMQSATASSAAPAGAQFRGWTLGESGSGQYVLDHFGPLTVRFVLRVDRRIQNGHHGIALYNRDGQVVWGTGTDGLNLEPGMHEIIYMLDGLPLSPGPYRWHVSIFNDTRFVDNYDGVPEMSVETQPLGHGSDTYAGFLNVPHSVEIRRRDADDRVDVEPSLAHSLTSRPSPAHT